MGVCPTSINKDYTGINNGINSGRFCWAISGTMCKGEVSGTYAKKLESCLKCSFYKLVENEEEREFILSPYDVLITNPK